MKQLFSILALLSLIISCQPTEDEQITSPEKPVPERVVTKITTTNETYNHLSNILELSYNDNFEITSRTSKDYIEGGTVTNRYVYSNLQYQNGNLTEYSYKWTNDLASDINYEYNVSYEYLSGQINSTSFNDEISSLTGEFFMDTDGKINKRILYSSAGKFVYKYYWTENNITKTELYKVVDDQEVLENETNITYDTNKNPYNYFIDFPTLSNGKDAYRSNNNPIKVVSFNSVTQQSNEINFTYEYDDKLYPTKVTYIMSSNGVTLQESKTFEYLN